MIFLSHKPYVDFPFTAFIAILFVLLVFAIISELSNNEKLCNKLKTFGLVSLALTVVAGIVIYVYGYFNTELYTYKVVVSDNSIGFNELVQQYEIISQDGLVCTLRDRFPQ